LKKQFSAWGEKLSPEETVLSVSLGSVLWCCCWLIIFKTEL
jgi:hypothetical protein